MPLTRAMLSRDSASSFCMSSWMKKVIARPAEFADPADRLRLHGDQRFGLGVGVEHGGGGRP